MQTRIIIITLLLLISLFCSLAFAGVDEWTSIGPEGGVIFALAVTPDGSTLYAELYHGGGVCRSTDGGDSWTAINNGLTSLDVMDLAIRPDTPTTLYAGTWGGVFRSTDGGDSWTAVNNGLTKLGVFALAIRPDTPTTLYAGTDRGGIFRSTDGGDSWTAVNNGLTNLRVFALTICSDTPTTLYAGTMGGGVFRSADGGDSWTAVNTGLTNLMVQVLVIRSDTPTTLYAGTNDSGVFRSVNGGDSWTAVNSGLTNLMVQALVIRPDTSTTLYAGTNGGGVFRSVNGGDSWTAVNTELTNLDVRALAIRPDTLTTVYAGTNGGVFRSADGGDSWATINTGLTNLNVRALAMRPDVPILYAGTYGSSVFSFTETVNAGTVTLDTPGPPTWTYTLTWNSGTVNEWFYRGAGITGASVIGDAAAAGWTVLKQTSTEVIFLGGTPLTGPGSLSSFQISGSQGGIGMWIVHSNSGTVEGPVSQTGDVSGNGEITAYDASLVLQHVVSLRELSAIEQEAADVTGDDTISALDAALILQYTVGLRTSFPVDGPPVAPALNPKPETKLLAEAIKQLENIPLTREQKQVLENLKSLVSKQLLPKRTVLLQNYPNSFNPDTWIPYQLAVGSFVTISIYNSKGHLIHTISLGNKPAGIYITKDKAAYWDGKDSLGQKIASGVYYYTLKTGNFIATRKMVILK